MSTTQDAAPAFALSDRAARRIAALIAKEDDPELKFRVSVTGGGCSGFQYNFGFDKDRQPDDLSFERDGVTVLVDETSLELLGGAELDFVEDLLGSYFQVKNPNAKSSCGCGTSFAI